MPVIRIEHTKNDSTMSNYHLRDMNLSLKAKGLLSQMLSLPEDWDYTLNGLTTINMESREAIRAAVLELERAGYLQRCRERRPDGKLGSAVYTIHELPQPVQDAPSLDAPSPSSGHPSSGSPTTGFPSVETPAT